MIKFLILFISSLFILCSCNSAEESVKKYVKVEYDSLYQEITYSIQDSTEQISLEVYLSKLNKGVLRYR